MCLILLAVHAHAQFPLIVAANRDETYSRPTAHASFWEDHPRVCGGRDLEQGGTWLGITRNGRFAALTNYRQGGHRAGTARSRGELTKDYLIGVESPEQYLECVKARAGDYHGFSLILGDLESYWFYSNRGGGTHKITPGVHGLSNHLLDEPWPKVSRGIDGVTALLPRPESELIPGLYALLEDRATAADDFLPATGVGVDRERALSASFLAGETYGTRASTALLVGSDAQAVFCERSFGPGGMPIGERELRYRLDYAFRRNSPAAAGA